MRIGECEYCYKFFKMKGTTNAKYCCTNHRVLAHYYKNKTKREEQKRDKIWPKVPEYDPQNKPGITRAKDGSWAYRHGVIDDYTTYNKGKK
jgi:hypothetical protein